MGYKISCVIPVYNAEKNIEKCVESIIFGDFKDIEVILVEDCSKDNSREVCRKLAEKYENVVCIANEKNSGVSYTRNRGLAVCSGEYIMFVDSDDWVSGKYAETMLKMAEKYPDALPICGFHFFIGMYGEKRVYKWNDEEGGEFIVNKENFFEIYDKLLIQSPCNKIFKADIIKENNILFDENEFMGEDLKFVLDYLKASKLEKCVMINEPLYYYLRNGDASLSGNFGLNVFEKSVGRFRYFCDICDAGEKGEKEFERHITLIKNNAVYHICRNKKITKEEKISRIEGIMQDGKASYYFKQQEKLISKENLVQKKNLILYYIKAIKSKPAAYKKKAYIKKQKKQLKCTDFSIISQNCVGAMFCHDMNLKFLTPTVNLFIKTYDFVKFAAKLEYYLSLDIKMAWEEEYPIGVLDDIKVYFMHYNTCTEAKETWNKRKTRVNFDKLIILSTDRNGFTDEVYEAWKALPHKKVLFTAIKKYSNDSTSVYYPEYEKDGCVPDLIPKREYYKDGVLLKTVNSYAD